MSLTYTQLWEKLRDEVAANGGAGSLVGYQFGATWPPGALYPREPMARILEDHGFTGAASVCRDVTPEAAATEAVRAKGAGACTRASRAASAGGAHTVVFHVERLEAADGHARAWGVYRERRADAERTSAWDSLGARIYVAPSGVYADRPVDGAEDPDCMAIAGAIVTHADVLLANVDGTLASRILGRAGDEAGTFGHLCAGLRLGMSGGRVENLVQAYLRLRADLKMPVNVEPRFRGGLSEAHVSESLVRALQGELDDLAATMRSDVGRDKFRGKMLDRRREQIRDAMARVERHRALLTGWNQTLSARLDSALKAYDGLLGGSDLVLPDWASEEPDPEATAEPPPSRPDELLASEPEAAPETAPATEPPPPAERAVSGPQGNEADPALDLFDY